MVVVRKPHEEIVIRLEVFNFPIVKVQAILENLPEVQKTSVLQDQIFVQSSITIEKVANQA